MKKKTLALLMACVLAIGCVIGGTMAWLTDTTPAVKNTFTTSDISITLTETDTDLAADGDQHNYKMVPGFTITKDPTVTVTAGSEDCYLFVKVEESANYDDFMTYSIADGWTEGTGTGADKNGVPEGVYYRVVNASTADQSFGVIAGNTVTVKDTVTKAMMNALTTGTQPTLTFTAYATQYYQNNTATTEDPNGTPFTVAEAWGKIAP